MKKLTRTGMVALIFLAGCAVGGASSRMVVPPANAQNVQRWDYFCFSKGSFEDIQAGVVEMKKAGGAGWELVTGLPMCFKRPL